MANYLDRLPWIPMSTADEATSAGGAAVTLSYTGDTLGGQWLLSALSVSYSAAPTGGNVQITDGTNVFFNQDITAGGVTEWNFKIPKAGAPNAALKVVLAGGGGAIVGKVSANVWLQR